MVQYLSEKNALSPDLSFPFHLNGLDSHNKKFGILIEEVQYLERQMHNFA